MEPSRNARVVDVRMALHIYVWWFLIRAIAGDTITNGNISIEAIITGIRGTHDNLP
jgi:hypothetical protein